MLHATYKNLAAYTTTTSPGKVTIVAVGSENGEPETMRVLAVAGAGSDDKASQPSSSSSSLSLLALGGRHLAVGLDNYKNKLHFYRLEYPSTQAALELKYPAEVLQLCLNQQYAAVLLATSPPQVVLHATEEEPSLRGQKGAAVVQGADRARLERCFGMDDSQEGAVLTCVALTDHFLFLGDDRGKIQIFSLPAWNYLTTVIRFHPLQAPIQSLHPNILGTRVLMIDATRAGYIYNPAAQDTDCAFLPVPDFPTEQSATQVLWDLVDRHAIHILDGNNHLHTYVYAASGMTGPSIANVGPLEISEDGDVTMSPCAYDFVTAKHGVPVLAQAGRLLCVGRRKLRSVLVPSYPDDETGDETGSVASMTERFKQSLALSHFGDAGTLARRLNNRVCWLALSSKAIELLDLPTAIWVYRALGDAGMVVGLEKVQHVEDQKLLAGHMALLFGRYAQAEELFLASSCPAAAVDMRRDLLQFQQALTLGRAVAPQDVTEVAVQYAQQLELQDGDYEGALRVYEMAEQQLLNTPSTSRPQHHFSLLMTCNGGSARCMLRIGHVRKGMALALALLDGDAENDNGMQESNSTPPQLVLMECARILETTKATWLEAAMLYERAGKDEHAARIYIQAKAFDQAEPLLARVTLPKLHALFANACEEEGKYAAAIAGYEKAHDRDSAIRLCLREDPRKAFELIRETASATGALMAAKHCQGVGDMVHCLEFLLLAQQSDEAFEVAKAHQAVDTYIELLLAQGRDVQHILDYYHQSRAWAAAGRLYDRLGQSAKALPLLLQGGAVEDAIRMVAGMKDPSSQEAKDLVAFLSDGPGKDLSFLNQLYVALGDGPQVVSVALARADQAQIGENYVEARSIVLAAIREVEILGAPESVLEPVRTRFMVLHSYFLVKILLRHEHHDLAARILLRVAKHVSCFPKQLVRLYTSVVLQCQRVGLTAAAYQHAVVLVADPQYRQEMDSKIRRKVETVVRRQGAIDQEEDDGASVEEEAASPCPLCNAFLPLTELQCSGPHRTTIPMCVISGRHMEREDWCICPNSGLPALYSAYLSYIETESKGTEEVLDPVCGKPVIEAQLVRVLPAQVGALLAKYRKA